MTGIARRLRERGLAWTFWWGLRSALRRVHARLMLLVEARLAAIERRRFLLAPDTVSAQRDTATENRERWSRWDWGERGEEWTRDAGAYRSVDPLAWKQDIVERFLRAHAPKDGVALEIGPGGGRWTEYLLEVCSRVHLADVSAPCLELCRERFGDERIVAHLVAGASLDALGDASIDFAWSYDAFVHINPLDTDGYLRSLARVLRPGARAVIHHPDRYPSHRIRRAALRSNLSAAFFRELCRRHGLEVLEQDLRSAHKPGDCITVLQRPRSAAR